MNEGNRSESWSAQKLSYLYRSTQVLWRFLRDRPLGTETKSHGLLRNRKNRVSLRFSVGMLKLAMPN